MQGWDETAIALAAEPWDRTNFCYSCKKERLDENSSKKIKSEWTFPKLY